MNCRYNWIRDLPYPPSKAERKANQAQSPITIFRSLTLRQYQYFLVGFLAWIMDAFDFFAVSVTLTRLEAPFNKKIPDLSQAITLTLLFRSFGALSFGVLTDRYGRRWPLTINLVCIALLALGTALVQTFQQFLAVRALFGIMMGGIYGMATATALENLPVQARGLFSGILQQGYAIGYLLAASVNLSLVAQTENWRSIFYLGAGLSFFIAILRATCPESDVFVQARQKSKEKIAKDQPSPTGVYWRSLKTALRKHYGRFIFTVFLMAGFNFLSHGSQDLYPTYVQVTKGKTLHESSLLTIIGNCGAIAGGSLAGHISQFLGRRLTMIVMILWTGAFIPLWILPNNFIGLAFGAFFLQFGVQGAWGVIPIYLSEIAPPAFRGIFTGLSYQLGNMISSASSQIEAKAGESHRVVVRGQEVADYAFVQGVLIGTVSAYLIIMICLGSEDRGKEFDVTALESTTDLTKQKSEIISGSADLESSHEIKNSESTTHDDQTQVKEIFVEEAKK